MTPTIELAALVADALVYVGGHLERQGHQNVANEVRGKASYIRSLKPSNPGHLVGTEREQEHIIRFNEVSAWQDLTEPAHMVELRPGETIAPPGTVVMTREQLAQLAFVLKDAVIRRDFADMRATTLINWDTLRALGIEVDE